MVPGEPRHPYSNAALLIMKRLARHGGCLRIAALAREAALPCDELCETLNDLAQRCWLKVTWRRLPHAALPARLRNAERVTLTRLGRARLPVPWVYPSRPSRRRVSPRRRPCP